MSYGDQVCKVFFCIQATFLFIAFQHARGLILQEFNKEITFKHGKCFLLELEKVSKVLQNVKTLLGKIMKKSISNNSYISRLLWDAICLVNKSGLQKSRFSSFWSTKISPNCHKGIQVSSVAIIKRERRRFLKKAKASFESIKYCNLVADSK